MGKYNQNVLFVSSFNILNLVLTFSDILTFAYHLTSLTNRRFVGDVSSNDRSTNILLGKQTF
ncbi:MAG: hypothetical protein EOO34_00055 [Cyanobacteriota bacterium]|nr:MAG: hypothetical protein EOO34_00055 [Cyanobacteriota bacterium]